MPSHIRSKEGGPQSECTSCIFCPDREGNWRQEPRFPLSWTANKILICPGCRYGHFTTCTLWCARIFCGGSQVASQLLVVCRNCLRTGGHSVHGDLWRLQLGRVQCAGDGGTYRGWTLGGSGYLEVVLECRDHNRTFSALHIEQASLVPRHFAASLNFSEPTIVFRPVR